MTIPLIVMIDSEGNLAVKPQASSFAATEVGARDQLVEWAGDATGKIFDTLGKFIGAIEKNVKAQTSQTKQVEIEFSFSLDNECNMLVLKGNSKAEFTIKITW